MVTGRPLLTVEQITNRVRELAAAISTDYQRKDLIAVGILRGAFMFFSDIVKSIQVPLNLDFLIVSSYMKTQSSGEVEIHADIREDIKNRHVLLIEDIVDTGMSLTHVREMLLQRDPASLRICTLLDKRGRRRVKVPLDYVGFTISNEFVVGYGLDYENKFRNLPYIAIFKKST